MFILDQEWYTLRQIGSNDIKLKLDRDLNYGWIKVHGQDMNNSSPVPLENGHYILCRDQGEAENNEIVVTTQGEKNTYFVRRLVNRSLVAECKGMDTIPEPIALNNDVMILGVVIAVAVKYSSLREKQMFQELVKFVGGDPNKVTLLIEAEKERKPDMGNNILLRNAYLRWILEH